MLNQSILSLNKKYIVGVSGGPDSMALLDMLRVNGYNIVVASVNYHKREDSDLDYEVVKVYCDTYQIPLAYKEIFEYDEGNFQAQARVLRYDFYEQLLNLYQCDAILLAHQLDDYLETVLMQKDRRQVDGLWGISETSKYHDCLVLRPLLHTTKKDLEDYCHINHVNYRVDSSNLQSDYTRNYFRNEVLKFYTDKQKEELILEAKKHNEEYLKKEISCEEWLRLNVIDGIFSLDALINFEDPLLLLKKYLLQETTLTLSHLSHGLIGNGLKALKEMQGNGQIHLPVNFVLIKEYDNVYVSKNSDEESYCFVVHNRDEMDYGYFQIKHEGHDRCGVCLKEEDFPLTVRTYQVGDVMELSYGKKKVSRLFIDAKIPRHKRVMWPIVLNAKGEIILVPQIAKNKDYLLAKPTWFVIQ